MKLKFTILIIAISLFSCTKRNLSFSKVNENADLVWNDLTNQNNSEIYVNEMTIDTPNNVDIGVKKGINSTEKIKNKILLKLVERKINKLKLKQTKRDFNNKTVLEKSKTASNMNWLWVTLLIAAVVVAALFITKFWGSILGLIALFALLILLYLILPEDMANAMGQAAIVLAINTVLQLLLSLL